MAFVPRSRMDPPPRSFAADAHDCIMGPDPPPIDRRQVCGAMSAPVASPSDHHPECKRLQNPARRLWAPQPTKKIDISIGTSPHAAPPVAQSHPLTPKAPYKSAQDDSGWFLRAQEQSGRDGFGVTEKTAVWGAPRSVCEAFVGQRQGNVALTGAQGGLGQGPVDDIALRVAAADLP